MTSDQEHELDRIRSTYEERDAKAPPSDWRSNIYHERHPVGHFFRENNRSALIRTLNALDLDLTRQRVLDVGCGGGGWLRMLVELGSNPNGLTGIDLSQARIEMAKTANPAIAWVHYNGGRFPFEDARFTFTMQVVVFSSILDGVVRERLAAEMLRVTSPDGLIMWIDLKTSTPGTLEGFSDERVLQLFPGCHAVHRDDLHPTYARSQTGVAGGLQECFGQLRYALTRRGCESTLLVLRKPAA